MYPENLQNTSYRFLIEDYLKGWEGTMSDMMQVSGVYAWICH